MRRLGVHPNRRRSRSLAAAGEADRRRASAGDCSVGAVAPARVNPTVTARKSIRAALLALAAALIFMLAAGAPRAGPVRGPVPGNASDPRRAVPRRPERPLAARRRVALPGRPGRRRDRRWLVAQRRQHQRVDAGDGPELVQRRRPERREHGRLSRLVPARFHASQLGLRPLRTGPLPQLDHQLPVGQLHRHRVAQRLRDRDSRGRVSAVRVRAQGTSTPASTG